MAKRKDNKTLAENRKARHDYFVDEAMEAGIALVGTEVKSIRNGRVNLKDCYADINNGEIFINNRNSSTTRGCFNTTFFIFKEWKS